MGLSVVIPAYNEIERLPPSLNAVKAYLAQNYSNWEIIVSDDGSTDGTVETLQPQFPDVKFLRAERNQGKGAAVRRGMLEAGGDLILFSDADLSTPIDELGPMADASQEHGYDIVIASRGLRESKLEVRQTKWREFCGKAFNRIVRPLSGLPFKDTQCGFKLFTREAAHELFALSHSDGWAFDVEVLMLAAMRGRRVLEMPVRWLNAEGSKVHLARDAPRMGFDILLFRWRYFSGRYDRDDAIPAREGSAGPSH